MDRILTANEFSTALRSVAGMSDEIVQNIASEYDRASIIAAAVVGKIQEVGFFTGKMARVEAFLSTCRDIDVLVDQKKASLDHAVLAISLLMFSSSNFHKSAKAFTRFAYGYRHQSGITTDSRTADAFFRSAFQS